MVDKIGFGFEKSSLSEKQIQEHLKLYNGYVSKIEEIRQSLEKADKNKANASFSEFRELKIEEGFSQNGVKLHELYFENIAENGKKTEQGREIKRIIESDFGSIDNWKLDLTACGLSSRGWVLLVYDYKDKKLHHYVSDVHNQGGIWETRALIVLDMYEHAFFIDFATDKKAYIEWFLNNIDWGVIENRTKDII